MRTCPDCRGKRIPCTTCNGWRFVSGEPTDSHDRKRAANDEQLGRAFLDRLARATTTSDEPGILARTALLGALTAGLPADDTPAPAAEAVGLVVRTTAYEPERL